MYSENHDIGKLITELMGEACQALFEDYNTPLTRMPDVEAVSEQMILCGVMGFVGPDLRGSCLLAGTQDPFERSQPSKGTLRDWVGELTNQLMGRVKIRLLRRGTEIALTTPIVLQGEHIAPLPRQRLVPLVFKAEPGHILVWLEVESQPADLKLGDEQPGDAPSEGGALFF
jgi:hypothetical protein